MGLFNTGFFFSVDYLNGVRSRDRDDIKVDLLWDTVEWDFVIEAMLVLF